MEGLPLICLAKTVFSEDNAKHEFFTSMKHMLNMKSIYINNNKVFTVKDRAVLIHYRFMPMHVYSQQHELVWN